MKIPGWRRSPPPPLSGKTPSDPPGAPAPLENGKLAGRGKRFVQALRRLRFFRPLTLYHYVLMQFLKSFGLALAVCTLVMLLGTCIMRAAELEAFGVTVSQMALLSPFFFPYALAYALPLAALIAAILVFGRLAAENEILAAQCGGASLAMLALPLLFCGAVLSAVSLYCLGAGVDWGFSIIRDDIFNIRKPFLSKKLEEPGRSLTLPLAGGGAAHINMLQHENEGTADERHPIHIYFRRGAVQQSLYARHYEKKFLAPGKSAGRETQSLRITLHDVQLWSLVPHGNPKFFTFKEFEQELDLPGLSLQKLSLGRSRGTVSFLQNLVEARKLRASIPQWRAFVLDRAAELGAQLFAASPGDPAAPVMASTGWAKTRLGTDRAANTWDKIRKEMVEVHRKLSLAFMPFSMIFLGVGLGLVVRKGHRLAGFALGIGAYVLLYYPLMIVSKELANARLIPAWALWISNVVLISLGLGLWWAHEHGYFGGGLPRWRTPEWGRRFGRWLWDRARLARPPFRAVARRLPVLFERRCDRYVARAFLAPLCTVALAVGGFAVVLDLAEHGGEVIQGVARAGQPMPGMPVRNMASALLDVFFYYGIRSLRMMFELMPVMILIAGVLAVTFMVRNNEHLIFKASGTRLQKAFLPVVLMAAALSLSVSLLREWAMPVLIMKQDRLKPLIYHRSPKTQSLAGQTLDAQGRPVIYEIARYSRNTRTCENMRIFLPTQAVNGRLPHIAADRALWNEKKRRWDLFMSIKTAKPKRQPAGPALRHPETRLARYGLLIRPVAQASPDGLGLYGLDCLKLRHFAGSLTPAFLDSEKYGPAVMRLGELWAVRNKPLFQSELWRRAFDWLTGFLLLMVAIPLLVKQEITSPMLAVTLCIFIGAAYLGLSLVVAEGARQGLIWSLSPVLPHLLFAVLGVRAYCFRMET